jgi:hypothetical protein
MPSVENTHDLSIPHLVHLLAVSLQRLSLHVSTGVTRLKMVTGIDTAGLILGSIPLIIEGLKIYQKGIKSVKRSVKYDVSLRKLIRRVEGQKLSFEDNLQKLLSGANSKSEDHIELGDDFWTEFSAGVVNQAVKEYLGERKQQYFHNLLDEFERYFVKLGNALNHVQRVGKVSLKTSHGCKKWLCNPTSVIQSAIVGVFLMESRRTILRKIT